MAVRPSSFEKLLLSVTALAFLVVAGLGWFAPDVLFGPVGVTISEPAGYAEIRAAYGGHFGACAFVFAAGAWRDGVTGFALRLGALVLAGFVFGRMYSLAVDGVPNAAAWAAFASEVVGLVSFVTALRSRARRRSQEAP